LNVQLFLFIERTVNMARVTGDVGRSLCY